MIRQDLRSERPIKQASIDTPHAFERSKCAPVEEEGDVTGRHDCVDELNLRRERGVPGSTESVPSSFDADVNPPVAHVGTRVRQHADEPAAHEGSKEPDQTEPTFVQPEGLRDAKGDRDRPGDVNVASVKHGSNGPSGYSEARAVYGLHLSNDAELPEDVDPATVEEERSGVGSSPWGDTLFHIVIKHMIKKMSLTGLEPVTFTS